MLQRVDEKVLELREALFDKQGELLRGGSGAIPQGADQERGRDGKEQEQKQEADRGRENEPLIQENQHKEADEQGAQDAQAQGRSPHEVGLLAHVRHGRQEWGVGVRVGPRIHIEPHGEHAPLTALFASRGEKSSASIMAASLRVVMAESDRVGVPALAGCVLSGASSKGWDSNCPPPAGNVFRAQARKTR